MKNVLLAVLFIVSMACATVYVNEAKDEFGEKTGYTHLMMTTTQSQADGFVFYSKNLNYCGLVIDEYTGMFDKNEVATVKIRTEDGTIHTFRPVVYTQTIKNTGYRFSGSDVEAIVNILKASNTIKIVVYDYNNLSIMKTMNCSGFTAGYNQLL